MARFDDDRRYGRYSDRGDDRGVMDRASDEVRSWFGDDDAQRRRHRDEMRDDRDYRASGRRDGGDDRDRFGGSYRDNGGSRERYSGRDYRDDDSGWMRSDRMESGRSRYGSDRGYGRRDYGDRAYSSQDYSDRDYGSDSMRTRDMGSSDSGSRGYGGYGGMGTGRSGSMGYGTDRYGSDHGPHSGRGPEGYSRSADRITEDVNEALTHHGGVDASKIRVSVEDGEVTLEGTVSSRREKRMAEDAAEDARGVRDVHNRLRISSGDSGTNAENGSNASSSSRRASSGKKAQKAAASS